MPGLSSELLPLPAKRKVSCSKIHHKIIGRYVYQVVVPKALAAKDLLQVYEEGKAVVLPPWDPLVRQILVFFIWFQFFFSHFPNF